MKEVEAYKLFQHSQGIIHSVDYSIAPERSDPQSKTVYVLLPYYRRGNLQDMINANLVNHTRFPERRLMQLFLGVCRALRDMHQYRGAGPGPAGERMEMRTDGGDDNGETAQGRRGRKGKDKKVLPRETGADEDDETEQQRPLMAEEEQSAAAAAGELRSYAHRDIKPGMTPLHRPKPSIPSCKYTNIFYIHTHM
jgi:serine/threonine kinase 16